MRMVRLDYQTMFIDIFTFFKTLIGPGDKARWSDLADYIANVKTFNGHTYCIVGWSNSNLFVIFENGHIAIDWLYFATLL